MKAILLALQSRLRFVFGRGRLGDETSEELKLHHELLTARYIDAGMSQDDARNAATRQLGNVTQVREDTYDMNSLRWLDVLVQDVRYAFRMAARTRGYAAVVIATMALGIGANTAILSVVSGVLLQPLPYVQPEQIYSVEIIVPERRDQIASIPTAIQTFQEWQRANVRLRLLLVLAASVLLLLTACASIANVVLARVASRASEFATRIALGAGRARIVCQSLTETIVLALVGGSIGAIIAAYGVDVLAAYGPEDLRLLEHAHLQTPLLLFALLVSLLTGAVCGIVPAWRAFRRDPGVALQEAARTSVGGRRAERSRQILVGVEVALATVLLASAGLLLHSFVKLMRADRGYDVQRVLAVDLSLFGQHYSSPTARAAFYAELLDHVRSLPGIVQAGGISHLPAASAKGASSVIFHATDTDFQRLVLARPVAMVRSVTDGYFVASGTALRAGRFLRDDEPRLVAVISESLASRMWPGEPSASIVGRQLRQGNVSAPLISVVGVVADEHPGGLDREPPPAIYRPYAQWASGPMTLVIKTEQEPATLARAVRAEVRRMDPNLPISAMRTMREIISSAVAQRRFQMALTSLFALVALLLGAVGLYGVVNYAVACRTREIGLRMALGALRTTVMRAVFASGMRPVFIGLAVGVAGTIATARALRHVLYEVSPTDPLSLCTVVLMMLLSSGFACYLPARRAAALEPIVALRHD